MDKPEESMFVHKRESIAKAGGRRDYTNGRRISENPYYKDTLEYKDWIAGWTDERNGQ